MSRILQAQLWKYYHDISKRLTIKRKRKRTFMRTLKTNINDYIVENPSADISQIQQQFGKPEEIADSYLSELPSEELAKQITRLKLFRIIAVILIVCMITYLVIFVHEAREHSAHLIEITIEKDPS